MQKASSEQSKRQCTVLGGYCSEDLCALRNSPILCKASPGTEESAKRIFVD